MVYSGATFPLAPGAKTAIELSFVLAAKSVPAASTPTPSTPPPKPVFEPGDRPDRRRVARGAGGEHLDERRAVVADVQRPVGRQRHVVGAMESKAVFGPLMVLIGVTLPDAPGAYSVTDSPRSSRQRCPRGVHLDVAGLAQPRVASLQMTRSGATFPVEPGGEDVDGVGLESQPHKWSLPDPVRRLGPRQCPATATSRPKDTS